jgi:hypothetical protein
MTRKNTAIIPIDQADNEFRKSGFEMIKIDFQMKYYTMIEAMRERVTATRISLTFLSAPFLVVTALLSAKIIDISSLSSIATIPNYIFIFILICGVASIVPLWHFIEANSRYMRTIRSINNFRDYYTKVIQREIKILEWDDSFLETDSSNPKAFNLKNWAGTHIILMALINSAYIAIGISCADGKGMAIIAFFAILFVAFGIQIFMYSNKK